MKLKLSVLNYSLGVCKLDKKDSIPQWAFNSEFFSITKTQEELSIVCREDIIPNHIKFEGHWRALKVEGPLDFSLIGILASISSILASANISIFAISTFDTDYILLKEDNLNKALEILGNNGYKVI